MAKHIRSRDDWFRLGAAVAVGELWAEGQLADADQARLFLASFGLKSSSDLVELGLGPVYLEDFKALLPSR